MQLLKFRFKGQVALLKPKLDLPHQHMQSPTHAITNTCNVNFSKRDWSEASTVMMIPRRLAPLSLLLVRPPLRISASRRRFLSLRLLVGSSSGHSTKTNSFCNWLTSSF